MKVEFDSPELQPLVRQVVCEVLEQIEPLRAGLGSKLLYSEREAADLLGIPWTTLRDDRLSGRIECAKGGDGSRVYYNRQQILAMAGMDDTFNDGHRPGRRPR